MLSKLIKHEFKASYRTYLPIYLTIFGLSIVQILTKLLNLPILHMITIAFTVLGIGGVGLFTIYNLVIAMGQRVYGKPGYLLFAIPAKTSDIILAKIITHFVWLMVTGFVFVVGIFAIFYSSGGIYILAEIWNELALLEVWTVGNLLAIALTGFVYMIYFLGFFMFLFAFMNLVYKGPHKILMGIVFYVVIDTAVSMITSIPLQAIFIRSVVSGQESVPFSVIWVVLAIYFVVASALLGGTYYIMDRKMELQ